MTLQEFSEGDEPTPEREPWRPPVQCPQCGTDQTRFVALRHEMSVYTCEFCDVEFEVEE